MLMFGCRTPCGGDHETAWVGSIYEAAQSGDVQRVKALLEAKPELVNAKEKVGIIQNQTPLFWASMNGHPDVVELLLAKEPRSTPRTGTERRHCTKWRLEATKTWQNCCWRREQMSTP